MSAVERFYAEARANRPVPLPGVLRAPTLPALSLFERQQGQRLLDIACYDGSKTAEIRDYLGARRACGVDFPGPELDAARRRGIEVLPCDLNEGQPIDLEDAAFDCIYLGDVLEHVFSPDHLLRESFRLLASGGYVVLTTPNLASWRNRIGLLLGWQPLGTEVSTVARLGNPFSPPGFPSGHLRVFTARALTELARLHGFRAEVVTGFGAGRPRGVPRLMDGLVARVRPTLGDELLARLRKPANHCGGAAGA